jgi:DNA-binding LacI/PurR family transcriptional regulator
MVTSPLRIGSEHVPTTPRRNPSLTDVAEAAGVSMQTVSRVSNGLDNVQPSTRLHVEAAMKRLGYQPNRAARALRTGRFKSIGVVVFTLESFGNMRTVEAIAAAAAAAGYTITLISAAARTREDVVEAIGRLEEQAVDGVILLIESHLVDETRIALPENLPVVIVDSALRPDHCLVDTDQAQGARLATEHLLELGHQTVHHIAGPAASISAGHRESSWRETLQQHRRVVPAVFRGDWTTHTGYEIGQVIALDAAITAVFVSNDQMALGLLRACHEAGRPVPSTLSIVGFDDMPESDSFWPPLTTIHQYFEHIGRGSIQALLSALDGDSEPSQLVVPTRLVVRSSTTVPPARPR